ncbi:hypothetical protein J3A72_003169 [Stenotrophomonas sp. PvP093]|uniref:Uncharacterized protein n=1 Tax=Stenotrophomonas pavanii TaxID=487698 RepID=A0A2D0ANX7_9GAMM|nr:MULTISPECIES: hypothetical protein [Stenotrophomonas]MBP2482877.1 hypothetical protein [Stenotrophomonas sp. PvP093]OWR35246.1 hypothetical protein CEE55_02240 [Stenotrophomonas pavanii]
MNNRTVEQLAIHLQQARSYARYLPGGENHGTVVEDHVLSPDQAAAAVVEELDAALQLLGAEA